MPVEELLNVTREALYLLVLIIGPPVGASLVSGLAVSIVQTATQIQEQTLVFIPKIVGIVAVLAITGPWMLNVMVNYTEQLLGDIPTLVANR